MAMTKFIRARVSDWEKGYILHKAKKANMTESDFIRCAALDKNVTVIEGADELLSELRYQGNNLNQLTIMARQGHIELVDLKPFTEVSRAILPTMLLTVETTPGDNAALAVACSPAVVCAAKLVPPVSNATTACGTACTVVAPML